MEFQNKIELGIYIKGFKKSNFTQKRVTVMKNHLNSNIYGTFYITKDINYQLKNPLETRTAPIFEINIRKFMKNSRISRNANCLI